MLYRAIGLMSGSSLDGLDIVFAAFQERGGTWEFEILKSECVAYDGHWHSRLKNATSLSARDYQLLHTEYGHYLGTKVNEFIQQHSLDFQVALVSSHGHTTFHMPRQKMTAQIGDGAAIAAVTRLPVVTDLRAMDVALGGQGAPIVPIGEQLLFPSYSYFLNLGGIANISAKGTSSKAFDVCPANKVLNTLAEQLGVPYDEAGSIALSGSLNSALLNELNSLDYYTQPFPKSLANEFGLETVYPIIAKAALPIEDKLATYVEHIAVQITNALKLVKQPSTEQQLLLITGGGAHNTFLIQRLSLLLSPLDITPEVPDSTIIDYKEALVMALIGVLRWREETNVLATVTGASRNSVGGALWMGQDA